MLPILYPPTQGTAYVHIHPSGGQMLLILYPPTQGTAYVYIHPRDDSERSDPIH
jgi:hypothetical protein